MPAPLSASVHDKPLAKAQDDIKAALAKQKQLSKKNTATDLIAGELYARSLGTSARGQNQALTNSSVTLKAPRLPHHEGIPDILPPHPSTGGGPSLQPHPPPIPPAQPPAPFKIPPWLQRPRMGGPPGMPFRPYPIPVAGPGPPRTSPPQRPLAPGGLPRPSLRPGGPAKLHKGAGTPAASANAAPMLDPDNLRLPANGRRYQPSNMPAPARMPAPVTPGQPQAPPPGAPPFAIPTPMQIPHNAINAMPAPILAPRAPMPATPASSAPAPPPPAPSRRPATPPSFETAAEELMRQAQINMLREVQRQQAAATAVAEAEDKLPQPQPKPSKRKKPRAAREEDGGDHDDWPSHDERESRPDRAVLAPSSPRRPTAPVTGSPDGHRLDDAQSHFDAAESVQHGQRVSSSAPPLRGLMAQRTPPSSPLAPIQTDAPAEPSPPPYTSFRFDNLPRDSDFTDDLRPAATAPTLVVTARAPRDVVVQRNEHDDTAESAVPNEVFAALEALGLYGPWQTRTPLPRGDSSSTIAGPPTPCFEADEVPLVEHEVPFWAFDGGKVGECGDEDIPHWLLAISKGGDSTGCGDAHERAPLIGCLPRQAEVSPPFAMPLSCSVAKIQHHARPARQLEFVEPCDLDANVGLPAMEVSAEDTDEYHIAAGPCCLTSAECDIF